MSTEMNLAEAITYLRPIAESATVGHYAEALGLVLAAAALRRPAQTEPTGEEREALAEAWDQGMAYGVNYDAGDYEVAPEPIENPYRRSENSDQPDGHKAEMIGACRSKTPHDGHDWQYSDTAYAECPGVPNQSDGAS